MSTHRNWRRSVGRGATVRSVVVASLCALVLPGTAAAIEPIEVTDFTANWSALGAGTHPNTSVSFSLGTRLAEGIAPGGCLGQDCYTVTGGAPKDVVVDLPPGLVGNPRAVPRCAVRDMINLDCPVDSQVGLVELSLIKAGALKDSFAPVYNMVPERGEIAKLGFRVDGAFNGFVSLRLRPDGEYAVTARTSNIFTGFPLYGAKLTVWGVPADPINDANRYCLSQPGCPATLVPRPFLAAPSACGVDLMHRLKVRSYQRPGDDGWTTVESNPLIVHGCERLSFSPSVDVEPTSGVADSASGLVFEMGFPQRFDDPGGLESPPLRDVEVVLPEGVSINPAAADGLVACSDDQLNLGSDRPVECPLASKVGSVSATSPVLEERLEGGVYVRPQASDDPGSGEMFRLALVLGNAERGISVRLPGGVRVDPGSGRVTAVFRDNPQLPVSSVSVRLKDGPRAPLALPRECGTKTVLVRMSAWSGHVVERRPTFEVDCAGQGGFAPGFEAGAVSPVGGVFSPFVASISRPEGHQPLSTVAVDAPKGVVAKLAGVQLCPEAVAGEGTPGTCPEGSRVGTATVGAGSGNPFYLRAPVYLTGPYHGGPYGAAVHVDVKAGPFDLGMVKVRNAIRVDAETAQVSVVSDALPQIVKGVPVRLRSIDVDVDRQEFVINPTSCAAKRVDAVLGSAHGVVHRTGSRFQVGDCSRLAFRPKLAMRLAGRRQTRTGGHPSLRAVVTQPKGQANIAKASVKLPRSIALDARNSYDPKLVCDYDRAKAADCPASSVIGRAVAHTPVLDTPLSGPVHLVQGIKFGPRGNRIRTTPTLLVKLRGKVAINVRAQTTVRDNRLVTTIPHVPDAPVSRFAMTINGGPKGILVVTRTRRSKIDLCAGRQTAHIETDGHNNRHADFATQIKTPCAGKGQKPNRKTPTRGT